AGQHTLRLAADSSMQTNTDLVGVGGYLQPTSPIDATLFLDAGGIRAQRTFRLGGGHWNRIGLAVQAPETDLIEVTIEWSGGVDIHCWGLAAGKLELPQSLANSSIDLDILNKTHLSPETYYLLHDAPVGIDVVDGVGDITQAPGLGIELKKCSYCGRLLPLDSERLGTLAFHKHNAKLTNHQNECRACKKWRINDDFNPKRTVDQLNESSIITRERKLFLREPERLRNYKLRTGSGLKSQTWHRFGKVCFFCKKPLKLSEVQLDHTRPLAYLWPIDEHATCLCAEHNNQKKDKFPVDFYNESQLRELSQLTGLPYDELTKKDINRKELDRIRNQITVFAEEWQPRTFAATARKILEFLPDVNLFNDLREADELAYKRMIKELQDRPPSVGAVL
ncbi:hypothetical protein, partial [Nocardia farcinica]